MPGYLDQYGSDDARRSGVIKKIFLVLAAILLFVLLPWYLFKNHTQEAEVRGFLDLLRKKDYPAAYKAWGCQESHPCSGYDYNRFLEDWGPKGAPDPNQLRIEDSESCSAGVMLTVRVSSGHKETLWVEKAAPGIAFAPAPVCTAKNFWGMLAHLTIGRLRKPFLN